MAHLQNGFAGHAGRNLPVESVEFGFCFVFAVHLRSFEERVGVLQWHGYRVQQQQFAANLLRQGNGVFQGVSGRLGEVGGEQNGEHADTG
jgi:hypothetical protein